MVFHLAVAVQVEVQVAVSHEAGVGVVGSEGADEHVQGVTLPGGAGVGGVSVVVQAALVADAYAVGIVAAGVDVRPFNRACGEDFAVAAHVEFFMLL